MPPVCDDLQKAATEVFKKHFGERKNEWTE